MYKIKALTALRAMRTNGIQQIVINFNLFRRRFSAVTSHFGRSSHVVPLVVAATAVNFSTTRTLAEASGPNTSSSTAPVTFKQDSLDQLRSSADSVVLN